MPASQNLKNAIKWPLRYAASQLGEHRRTRQQPRLWIMMYHRVLPDTDPRFAAEEPGMLVTPAMLEMHLRYLQTHFEIVSLSDWIDAQQRGEVLPDRACAITFDDGWRDNHEFALPLLQQYRVPATVFAVSHMIGTSQRFWPNRISEVLQALPANWREHSAHQWLALLEVDPLIAATDREAMATLISRAKRLSDSALQQHLDASEAALGITADTSTTDLMSWQQLEDMQASGLVNIGSHTCHHQRLDATCEDALTERELIDSQAHLQQHLQRPVDLFCFPNGDQSPHADRIVRQHYRGAVTTRHGINSADADPHDLARVSLHVGNSDTELKLAARLSGWRGV